MEEKGVKGMGMEMGRNEGETKERKRGREGRKREDDGNGRGWKRLEKRRTGKGEEGKWMGKGRKEPKTLKTAIFYQMFKFGGLLYPHP